MFLVRNRENRSLCIINSFEKLLVSVAAKSVSRVIVEGANEADKHH